MDGMGHDAATTSANVMEKDKIEHLTLKDLGKLLDELAKNNSMSCIYFTLQIWFSLIEFLYF